MKIFINYVGLINKACIETDGVTVIGGYNNSGKSTILKGIYALLYSDYCIKEKILNERKQSLFNLLQRHIFSHELYYYIDIGNLVNLIFRKYYKYGRLSYEEFLNILTDKTIRNEGAEGIVQESDVSPNKTELFKNELPELYKKVITVFKRSDSDYEKFIFSKYFNNVFTGNINMYNNKQKCKIEAEIDGNTSFAEFSGNKLVSCKGLSGYNVPVFYISTSHFIEKRKTVIYSELNRALKRDDGLDIVYESYNDTEENKETLKSILQEILHGNISFSDEGLVYKDENINSDFHINNVASGMKNLLVIQKLLNNGSLGRNSILLIDEPETNLHPEWQVKFAEILVLLNKELGIKVIANSHSPYFMRAVEVKLSDYGIKEKGYFYLMQEDEKGTFCTEDVTDNTDKIYKMLYKPLEYL